MRRWDYPISLALASLAVSLGVGWLGAAEILRESPRIVTEVLESLLVSGGLALAAALAVILLAMPLLLRLALKVGIGYLTGSIAAIITIMVMMHIILTNPRTPGLLVLYMVSFLVISLGLAIIVSATVTQPLTALTTAVNRIAAGDLSTQVAVPSRDELFRLASAFNRMSKEQAQVAGREQEAEEARRRLIVAISHDLRTPLTAMRVTAEALSQGIVQGTEIALYLKRLQHEIDLLSRLTDDLLSLSELEAGAGLQLMPVALGELAEETVDRITSLGTSDILSVLGTFPARAVPCPHSIRSERKLHAHDLEPEDVRDTGYLDCDGGYDAITPCHRERIACWCWTTSRHSHTAL